MKRPQKKTPADYPQFAFRMKSFEEKEALDKEIDEVQKAYNSSLRDGEKTYRKNDIILEALSIGLHTLKKKAPTLRR